MAQAFIHGLILAFGLIIPLGVQNVFIFNQGATQPTLLRALPAVITASLCDTVLILLAVLGVSVVVLQVSWLASILYGAGFLFLLYMGWVTWKSAAANAATGEMVRLPTQKQIAFTASVSLLNPHAILDTIGVIGTSSLGYSGIAKWGFTAACILVSYCWFLGLSIVGRRIGSIDRSGKRLALINRISAVIIWGVALYMGAKWLF
ncbi:LysE/ArgO family amino acid transporter [Brevibacillus sp. B_LB10_24]|uniref:LysE/ArgO family amino acid transporter n=1 Tax=Brevibacillus sp. B_LB10_24 TaxID=3380645 RepID=UPI0038B89460